MQLVANPSRPRRDARKGTPACGLRHGKDWFRDGIAAERPRIPKRSPATEHPQIVTRLQGGGQGKTEDGAQNMHPLRAAFRLHAGA